MAAEVVMVMISGQVLLESDDVKLLRRVSAEDALATLRSGGAEVKVSIGKPKK